MTNATKQIGTVGSYSDAVSATRSAVSNELTGVNKWQKSGSACRAHFGSENFMLEIKAQFIADAILPELDKRHAKALATELPRKNSKEFNALDAGQRDMWEAVNQAKKDARATCDTMFSRVVKYAFPAEKKDSESVDLKTKLQTQIADLIKKCQKAEDASFHISSVLEGLEATLKALNSDRALTITVK
jgi:hypothetical protein